LQSLALALFDLSELDLYEVLLVLHSKLLSLNKLIRVLRIRQLPLRLIQLIGGVVMSEASRGSVEEVVINDVEVVVGACGHIGWVLVRHEVVAWVHDVELGRVLSHLMEREMMVVDHCRIV
jgi:hypothetical protein